jgi:alpha-N-arabinofuranosidase
MNRIKIDLERVTSDIDRNIFGGYLENLVYGGIYLPDSPHADKDGLRTDVLSALERWKLPNMRYPGGNFVSNYRWRDGIGPVNERPVTHNLAWNSYVTNRFGTDEFIRFCRKMNITPYICANCGDGDMREAADWVEYCNGTGNSALANLRRKNGFDEPHKVKLWGIGNEVDGVWQVGYKTPQEYARAAAEFGKVMKRVDPEIKIVGSAVSLWEDHPFPLYPVQPTEWVERTQLLLEQAGDYLDYLSIHRYANPNINDPFETFMAFGADFEARLTAYEGLISSVCMEKNIKHKIGIAVDEWGVMRLPHVGRFEKLVINLEDALITGLYLNSFIRHAHSVRLASFTPTMSALGVRSADLKAPLLLETLFYPFELYSRTCGQQSLDVFWEGDTFCGTYLGCTYPAVRTLDVTATLDEARKQLVVYVVNQSKDKAMDATITINEGQFAGNVKVSVINGPDIKSENSREKPYEVKTRESTIKANGRALGITFEPHSVTALVCGVN